MCGVIGAISTSPVNQILYDGLLLLQHRGQTSAGIATAQHNAFYLHKANGLVRDVFQTSHMMQLHGTIGIGHVRYPTIGSDRPEEAQPFYVNAPYGIMLAHNGNLTNGAALKENMARSDHRHINTHSDSEILLNVLAYELQKKIDKPNTELNPEILFSAMHEVYQRLRGSYAVVAMIASFGLIAFRDPFGIRPLCFGKRQAKSGIEWMIASESVALEGSGFTLVNDIAPGEVVLIDQKAQCYRKQCIDTPQLAPCIFEYVYLARPDSSIDGVSVYDARLRMGDYLAQKIASEVTLGDIDVVMPIPDSSRPAAMQVAKQLNISYREGFFKNHYIGRTFIMPGQVVRKKSVRQKLNAMSSEFKGKNVLIVDDSIVRGTTSKEIIHMARDAGARRVVFASAAAAVQYPNVYGIDLPARSELVAYQRDPQQIAQAIGADQLIYQDINDMRHAISDINPKLTQFDTSCFDGIYLTELQKSLR